MPALLSPTFLIVGLFALLLATGWAGWRFFYACPEPQPPEQKALVVHCQQKNLTLPKIPWLKVGKPLLLALLPLCLVVCVVMLVLRVAREKALTPLEVRPLAHEQSVRDRLQMERLLPPPPLPPSVFITTEAPYLHLESADRDWGRINPAFAQVVLQVFAKLEKQGYPFALIEGYRSPARQDMLANLGRHVTHARGLQSKHCHGLAVDVAPMREGRLVISERDPWAARAYQALGQEAENLGLTWGGRWTLRDYGHLERSGRIASCKK